LTVLSVNVNKIALLRNAREGNVPDVVAMARLCIDAGAEGITVHPRPDLRHVRPADVRALADAIDVELNVEGNPFSAATADYPGFMALVRECRPAQATLVPDSVAQLTSDHGWNIAADRERLAPVISALRAFGCRVSLFVDPGCPDLRIAREIGADRIELYTEAYATAHAAAGTAPADVLERYAATAREASELGLGINAGHDLNLDNLTDFCAAVPGILEVSIGQALVADALRFGLPETVRRYRACLASPRAPS
jgi:pyridoxine 5-phosphate synthase